jgi:hypothetical protein
LQEIHQSAIGVIKSRHFPAACIFCHVLPSLWVRNYCCIMGLSAGVCPTF